MLNNNFTNNLLRPIYAGIFFSVICIAVQQSSNLISIFSNTGVKFVELEENVLYKTWKGEVGNLDKDLYFISIGRPKSRCDILIDGVLFESNGSSNIPYRNKLFLGGIFEKSTQKEIILKCYKGAGFNTESVGLTHSPIVSSFFLGVFLHYWRIFLDLLLGPICSLILLIYIIIAYLNKIKDVGTHQVLNQKAVSLNSKDWAILFFTLTGFFYSLSLAHFPRLILHSQTASLLHIFLRNLFSISALCFLGQYSKQPFILITFHIFAIIGAFIFNEFSPEKIKLYYNWQYILFLTSTFIVTYKTIKLEGRTQSIFLIKALAVCWSIVQIIDIAQLWLRFGSFLSPYLVALMTAIISITRYNEGVRERRLTFITSKIFSVIESKSPIREILAQLASIVSSETNFTRVSAYIDGFCIGIFDQPNKIFIRSMEYGYKKETKKDLSIDFSEGRGRFMSEAILNEKPMLHRGSIDKAWFLVIPIGKHACINLSNTSVRSDYSIYESEEIIKRLMPALKNLGLQIFDYSLKHSFALERLRATFGDGQHEIEVGSIFVDINDYSHFTERYGQSFSNFLSTQFFPTLIKNLGKLTVPEFVRGDEIYFVCIKELLPENTSVKEAVFETTRLIQSYSINEGAQLCEQYGFEPLSFSIGMNIGLASLICDNIKVRTAGQIVNEAKRLQEAAGKGQILVKSVLAAQNPSEQIFYGEEQPILVKKNFILARSLNHKQKNYAA